MKPPRGLPSRERQQDYPTLYGMLRRELDRRPGWGVADILAGERVGGVTSVVRMSRGGARQMCMNVR